MDWKVRKASLVDTASLALVGGGSFLDTFAGVLDGGAIVAHCEREHSASAYRNRLQGGAAAWLAELSPGGAPIGYALVAEADLPGSASEEGDLELKRIYTLSRFQGAGVGAGLMSSAVRYAESLGCRRLLLGVYAGNARARAFYAKNGFRQISERTFRVGDREYDDVVLAKLLDSQFVA